MSGSLTPTVAAPPTAVQAAVDVLALMAGLSGVTTDYNPGSQVRTLVESVGAVLDIEGTGTVATVLQGMAYGAMSLFGITSGAATYATGFVTWATAFPVSGAPVATQPVSIPLGALVQTPGGVAFSSLTSGLLVPGTTSVTLPAIAVVAGVAGNIPPSGIAGQPLTPLGYPLSVSNSGAFSGGQAAPQLSQSLALFTAKAGSLGLCSPYAIANAMIGVSTAGGETVQFSTVFEPWIAAGSGAGSGTAGFTIFVDNGTGSASSGLLSAVTAYATGNIATQQSGYRPAGVPFGVSGVVPVNATVTVSGVLAPGFVNAAAASGAASTAVQNYFTGLGFNNAATQPQIAAAVVNAALGYFTSITVNLFYVSGGGSVTVVSGGALPWRPILTSLNLVIGY